MSNRYSKAKAELFSIDRKIHEAEKNAEGEYIQSLRRKKSEKEDQIKGLQLEIAKLNIVKDEMEMPQFYLQTIKKLVKF